MRVLVAVMLVAITFSGCGSEAEEAQPAEMRQNRAAVTETIDGNEVDLSLLPPELQPLAPLIRKYAASDDVEREQKLKAASSAELEALREAPVPHWDAINAYLDANIESEPGPKEDVAFVLESFAQAAQEAEIELEEREGG